MNDEYDEEYTYAGIGLARNKDDQDDSSDGASSDDNTDFISSKKKENDSQIYGVFGESSDEEGGQRQPQRQRGSSQGKRKGVGGAIKWKKQEVKKGGLESMFVKSTAPVPIPSTPKDVDEDDKDQDQVSNANISKELETEEDIQSKKDQVAANDKFNALLGRGKRKRSTGSGSAMGSNYIATSKPVEKTFAEKQDSSSGGGLGFRSQGSGGLGFGSGSGGLGFGPGSGSGLGFNSQAMDEDDNENEEQNGPSLSSFFASSSKMANFVGESQEKKKPPPPIKKDPNLGTWEKHTKGIGMKLLSQMGYKGSGGLGSKRLVKTTSIDVKDDGATVQNEKVEVQERTGISRPVEVVVRPQNLGLGFGSFKEATKLKANQRIEAEVRGVDWEKKEAEERRAKKLEEEKRTQREMGFKSSALPTTDSLLTASNWRKGGGGKRRKQEKAKMKVISYQDIIGGTGISDDANQGAKKDLIVDMRGPSMTTILPEQKDENGKVLLGEELLHNVTFLLNKCENKLHSNSHFVRSSQSKAKSLKSDVSSMEHQRSEIQERRGKLEKVLSLIDQLEKYQHKLRFNIEDKNEVAHVENVLHSLSTVFTQDEKKALQYYTVLIPSLLGPIIAQALKVWQPLTTPHDESQDIISKILNMCLKASGDGDSQASLLKVVFISHMLPPTKKALQSLNWDPVVDVESALTLYESMLSGVERVKTTVHPKKQDNDRQTSVFGSELHTTTDEKYLTTLVKDTVMFDIFYPKLSRALTEYKAGSTGNSLDSWILPWLPHLDYRSMLTNMLPELKRKIRSAIILASKMNSSADDDLFFRHTAEVVLKPWISIINTSSLHSITSECITPRLGRYLSKMSYSRDFARQDLSRLKLLFTYYNCGMLSDTVFLSLVEGEVMLPLASVLHGWLESGAINVTDAAALYHGWKMFFLQPNSMERLSGSKGSWIVLGQDTMICRILYGCLLAIKASESSDSDKLDDLEPPPLHSTNYRVVHARRAKEERLREEEEELRGKPDSINNVSRMHASSHGRGGATFREVVEDFANHNGIPFHPKSGPNSTKDGKTVFMFGNAQVYLDSSVAFVLQAGDWKPKSLNDLLSLA